MEKQIGLKYNSVLDGLKHNRNTVIQGGYVPTYNVAMIYNKNEIRKIP